jgi:hypothetical protein
MQVNASVTIHRRPENSQLGMHFVHNLLRKRPYTLCRSCRGMLDLQLSYSNFCALQFKFLEKSSGQSRQVAWVMTLALQSGARDGVRASSVARPRWARTPRPFSVHRSARRGPRSLHRTAIHTPFPGPTCHMHRGRAAPTKPPAAHWRLGRTRPCRRRTLPCCAPYRDHSLGTQGSPPPLLAFKSRPPPPRAQGALVEPLLLTWVATRSSTRRSRSHQPALPVRPLGPPVASPPTRCPGRAPGSPKPKLQRRPPPAFAVPLAGCRRRPKPAPKSVVRSP